MNYDGKNAVVIGGSHGMGLATAKLLIERGARVLVTGRNEQNLEDARNSLGTGAQTVRSDASNMDDITLLGAVIGQRLGAIDFLHVNVGIAELAPFEQVNEASFDRQFAVNTKGAFFTVQRLSPLMREGGSIVMTSSVADEGGEAGMIVYSATKAALVSMASEAES